MKTLQRWDRQGVLRAHRTPTNRRYYTTADLESILPQAARAGRRTVAYCRVSSVAQKPDLITITHCFSSRLYGLRNYRKALEKVLKDENRTQNSDEPDA